MPQQDRGLNITRSSLATTTMYTGIYNSPKVKRTPALTDESKNHGFVHNLGFSPWHGNPHQQHFEVDCLKQETTFLISTSTVVSTGTTTGKPSTIYLTSTYLDPISTLTHTLTPPSPEFATCTTTLTPTMTTTQNVKCAPTNLLSSLDGYGITQTQAQGNVTEGLAPGSDPSACCQLCIDTAGCAAIADDVSAGNCFLYYTTPSCGLGFLYAGDSGTRAGGGFFVQTGCGSVQAIGS